MMCRTRSWYVAPGRAPPKNRLTHGARDHFQVALDRDLLGNQSQLGRELRQRQAGGDALMLAIDGYGDGAVGVLGHAGDLGGFVRLLNPCYAS